MLSPSNSSSCGREASTASQIGCGRSWVAHEPKAMRASGPAGRGADRPRAGSLAEVPRRRGRRDHRPGRQDENPSRDPHRRSFLPGYHAPHRSVTRPSRSSRLPGRGCASTGPSGPSSWEPEPRRARPIRSIGSSTAAIRPARRSARGTPDRADRQQSRTLSAEFGAGSLTYVRKWLAVSVRHVI